MELAVLIQQMNENGYRAWCGEPIATSAEGATRDEALANLKTALEAKIRGIEVVRLSLPTPATPPFWPDDQITRDWLSGIEDARAASNRAVDPWDDQP